MILRLSALLASVAGCVMIGLSPEPDHSRTAPSKATVNYAEHVAAILNEHCVTCHRPGEVAPFSLIGYENAKKWAPMIAQVTQSHQMPPWKAVPGYGEFKDANTLDPLEIETLKNWAESTRREGDPKKAPPEPSFSSDWTLGKPDMIVSPSKPYRLSAEGPDVYRNFVFHTNNTEPIWVRAIDVKPGNKRIVHHVIAFVDGGSGADKCLKKYADGQEGYSAEMGGLGFLPRSALGGWAPGVRARSAPDGDAFQIPPHGTLILQIHYHKTGKPEEDRTRLGIYTTTKPEHEVGLNWIFRFDLNIPAGVKDYRVRKVYTYKNDTVVYGAMPHMHLLGRSMKSWFEFPDGTTKPLVFVDDWDFNWQLIYSLKQPIRVPAGTRQVVEAVFDNSLQNPRNPNNPPKTVHFGEQTTDEMFLLVVPYTLVRPGELDSENWLAGP